jgi:hypothetical protein
MDDIYALIDANRAKAEHEYYMEQLKIPAHVPLQVEDRDIEHILMARSEQHALRKRADIVDSSIIVNPEIWKWFDTLFVHRPDTTFSVNTTFSVLKPLIPQEKLTTHAISAFAKFDRNIINEILKYCGIQTVARLSVVNKWLHAQCMRDEVWEELFSRLCTLKEECDKQPECSIRFKSERYRFEMGGLTEAQIQHRDDQHERLIGWLQHAFANKWVENTNTERIKEPPVLLRYWQDTKSLLKRMEIVPTIQAHDAHFFKYGQY